MSLALLIGRFGNPRVQNLGFVQVLKVGYRLPFVSHPPLSPTPNPLPSYSPQFHPGVSSVCFRERLADQGCHRTGILRTQVLQPFICYSEGHGQLAASH